MISLIIRTPENCIGVEVLDFRPHPCHNIPDAEQCEAEWPCELREYWLHIHNFVVVTRDFLSYGSIIIVIVGILLNALSFYILWSSGLAKRGSGIYLMTLAVCDSLNLLLNIAIGVWRGASYDFNQYFMDYEWLCRIHGVLVEVFQTISAWIVVAFTVVRCLAVWKPMTFQTYSTTNHSKIVVASITAIFTLFCMSKLFLTGFEKDSVFGYTPCNSRRFVWQGMAYVRVAFQTWIPTIFVFVFNCLMFWKLRHLKTKRRRLTGKAYRKKTVMLDADGLPRKLSFMNKPSPTNPMLIAVSLAYLVLVFPLGAVQTVELYWNVHRKVPIATKGPERGEYINWMETKLLIKYIRSFFFAFYQLNFAINFFLYFAAGVEFRQNLQRKCQQLSSNIKRYCCCKNVEPVRQQSNGVSQSQSTSVGVTVNPVSLTSEKVDQGPTKTITFQTNPSELPAEETEM